MLWGTNVQGCHILPNLRICTVGTYCVQMGVGCSNIASAPLICRFFEIRFS